MKRIILMTFLVSLIFVMSGSSTKVYTITGHGSSVVIEDQKYKIGWDIDVVGSVPGSSDTFRVEGELVNKQPDRIVDVAIVSPVQFKSGSEAYLTNIKTITTEYINTYECNEPSSNYGWIVVGESFYCNNTRSYNETDPYWSNEYVVHNITEGYWLDLSNHPNSAKIRWNVSKDMEILNERDITNKFSYLNKATPYGDYIYFVQDVMFKSNKSYNVKFNLKVSESVLPVKYSVVFGNFSATPPELYLVLDPTIVSGRTWTSTVDFRNGTNDGDHLNVSLNDGEIILENPPMWVEAFDRSNGAEIEASTNWTEFILDAGPDPSIYNEAWNIDFSGSPAADHFDHSENEFLARFINETDRFDMSIKSTDEDSGNLNVRWRLQQNDSTSFSGTRYIDCWIDAVDFFQCYDGASTTQIISWGEYNGDSFGTDTWVNISYRNISYSGDSVNIYINDVLNVSSFGMPSNDLTTKKEIMLRSETRNNAYNISFDTIKLWNYSARKTQGIYSDRQGWSPQTSNQFVNISVSVITTSTSDIKFRYNKTNASLDTSGWVDVDTVNGTVNVSLDMDNNDDIFYQFRLSDTSSTETPRITSYTIREATQGNQPSTVTTVNITPESPYSKQDLFGHCEGSDPDNTTIHFYWTWFRNQVHYSNGTNLSLAKDTEHTLQTLDNLITLVGDTWEFNCVTGDGLLNSSDTNSTAFFIMGQLNGTVVDRDNNLIENATVVAINQSLDVKLGNYTTGTDGEWFFNVTTPGNYSVVAWDNFNTSRGGNTTPHINVI